MKDAPELAALCMVQNGKLKLFDLKSFSQQLAQFGEGEELDLTIRPLAVGRTRQQEKGFHAMISPWARAEGHTIDDLKRDLLAEIFGLREHVDVLTSVVVMVLREPHTSKLSKAQYNELIERTLEIAARCGHELIPPSEWRARQAQAAREKRKAS